MPTAERMSLEELRDGLREPVQAALVDAAGPLRIEYLCEPKDVADDPAKLLIQDASGASAAVALVSSPVEPDLVGRGMKTAAEARQRLGERLGSAILVPLAEGRLRGLSYTILPYRRPLGDGGLSQRYWRWTLRPRVLDWLYGVAERTHTRASDEDVVQAFEEPLRHLSGLETMHADVREAAHEALECLQRRAWTPHFVLMHGDLWQDNLLRAAAATPDLPFVVIDWPGAQISGYPFFDLLRIARSMRLGRAGLRREVARHCALLDADAQGALGHLLACLGHTGLDLGCFPMEMYIEMSVNCLADLRQALGLFAVGTKR